jgi:hypothetical protein
MLAAIHLREPIVTPQPLQWLNMSKDTHSQTSLLRSANVLSTHTQHERVLERIGQYLKGTQDKGLILHPIHSTDFMINCYVDANFAGMWGYKDTDDPACVKSRTGFVIFIMDCPVVWTSKL